MLEGLTSSAGDPGMAYVTIVAVLALVEYYVFVTLVGKMRGERKIQAPTMSGDPKFDRYLRVQQNTAEQLVVFLPGIFLFALYWGGTWAALAGLVFVVGRAAYAVGYYEEAKKRATGFAITFLAQVVLVVGALVGAVRALL